MSFPDILDKPSRTITSTCTRVSRESIIVKEELNKKINIREKACIQSFPINFEFFSSSYSSKEKMIGNAIPPILTYFIFESMKMTKKNDVIPPNKLDQKLFNFTITKPIKTPPPIPNKVY